MAVPLPVSSCRTPNSDQQAGVRREAATSNFHDFWDNSEGETAMIETELNGRFDPFDPAFCNDPFPFYRSLVNQRPLTVSLFSMPIVLVARYEDAVAVLRDPERFSSRPLGLPGAE